MAEWTKLSMVLLCGAGLGGVGVIAGAPVDAEAKTFRRTCTVEYRAETGIRTYSLWRFQVSGSGKRPNKARRNARDRAVACVRASYRSWREDDGRTPPECGPGGGVINYVNYDAVALARDKMCSGRFGLVSANVVATIYGKPGCGPRREISTDVIIERSEFQC